MNEQHKYRSTDKMSDLICDNYSLLMVMSRFGLSLGFGDKSVKDVCEAQGVDCPTFLAVANFISEEQYSYSGNESDFSIPALMDYLKRAHTYFLDFNLPAIRRKLIEAIDCSSTNDVAYLILKFFDEYAKEVRRHMEYENQAVFTYVEQLLQGRLSDEYNIATFASKHNHQILPGKGEQQSPKCGLVRYIQLRTRPCHPLPGRRLYVCSRRSANRKETEK